MKHSLGQESCTAVVLIRDRCDSLPQQEKVVSSDETGEVTHSKLELATTRFTVHLLDLNVES